MGFTAETAMVDVAINSAIQGLCVGLIWVPLTIATFATLDRRYLPETSAVYHLLRNVGSSIFISLSVFTVINTSQISYAQLIEFINPFNEVLRHPQFASLGDLSNPANLVALRGEVAREAQMLGFIDAFGLYMFASLIVVPLALLVRVPKRGHPA